ncbi:MAG: esterase, partial [Corynebacterium casei]|nr:esterase [Corynebacterium casei]
HVVIDVGVREGAMVNKAHMLAMALKARDIKHELYVHDGGHDWAWWRVALLEHLGAKLEG